MNQGRPLAVLGFFLPGTQTMKNTSWLSRKRTTSPHVQQRLPLRRDERFDEKDQSSNRLDDLYEKLYFHEIEARESINQRLQIPLAVLVVLPGILGQMLQTMERGQPGHWFHAFWFAVTIAACCLAASFFFFARSQWGHRYKYLPTAEELEDYKEECVVVYAEYPERDQLVDHALRALIHERTVECSTRNSIVNARKSEDIALLNRSLVLGGAATFISFFCFYFGELDKKYHEIKIVEPIELKGPVVATKPPPPPPPPGPPAREIREGHRPPPPPQPAPPRRPG
jgi:hypothetical protein